MHVLCMGLVPSEARGLGLSETGVVNHCVGVLGMELYLSHGGPFNSKLVRRQPRAGSL